MVPATVRLPVSSPSVRTLLPRLKVPVPVPEMKPAVMAPEVMAEKFIEPVPLLLYPARPGVLRAPKVSAPVPLVTNVARPAVAGITPLPAPVKERVAPVFTLMVYGLAVVLVKLKFTLIALAPKR